MLLSRKALALCLTFTIAACERVTLDAITAPPNAHRSLSTSLSTHPIDDRDVRIAETVPAYGGMYYVDGRLFIVLTDAHQLAAAKEAMVTEYGAVPSNVSLETATVIPGRYNFSQLRLWADQLQDRLGSRVLGLGVNRTHNAVKISVADFGSMDEVRAIAAELRVPDDALFLSREAPARPMTDYLTDVLSAHYAGQKLWVSGVYGNNLFSGENCTLGFSASLPSDTTMYFITNSHCTNNLLIIDGSVNSVHWITVDTMADESHDPAPSSCFDSHGCRYADAALARFRAAYRPTRGLIYKTTWVGSGRTSSDTGSKALGTYYVWDPMYVGGDAEGWAYQEGVYVEKMGARTGWTQGPLINLCYNTPGPGSVFLWCQGSFGSYDNSGDSGSPVFKRTFQYDLYDRVWVLSVGVVWGGSSDANGAYTIFSPIGGVRTDLGSLSLGY